MIKRYFFYTLGLIGVTVTGAYLIAQAKIKKYAEKFIGITEKANNSGFNDPYLQEKMKNVGWVTGQPWCAFYVKIIWMDVFSRSKNINDIDRILSGSTVETWKNAKNDDTGTVKVIKNRIPQPGDIAIWQKYNNGVPSSYGHAAIVTKGKRDSFISVEGNTTDELKRNTREGYIIYKKTHSYNYDENSGLRLLGFIRYNFFNIF